MMLESTGVPRESFEVLGRRFEELVPLTTEGAFRLLAGREIDGGEARVVVVGAGDGSAAAWEAQQLDAMARAHAQIDCRYVPRLATRGAVGGLEYLALACDASTTLGSLMHWSAATRQSLMAFEAAIALPLMIGETLQAVHRVVDPHTRAPLCIGSLGSNNVLISPDGRTWVIGFGYNAATALGPGSRAVAIGSHQAPEVGRGAPATPASDVYVFDLFFRSLLPFVELLPRAQQAVAGQAGGLCADAAWPRAEHQRRLSATQPTERFQSMDETMRVYCERWRFLGVEPDIDAYVHHVARLQQMRTDITTLMIARDASWFRAPSASRVDIAGRKALRGVLHELAGARLRGPGRPTAIEDLLLAGWPGEKVIKRSGCNRVYVAIATLRQLGLGDLLRKHATGYLLDPGVPLALA
jgi:hypothetical protein